LGKISENQGKIPENLNKIPKHLCKIPENLGKNGAQRCLTLKNGDQRFRKMSEDHFLEVIPKMIGISCTTTFWARKSGQKSFAPPKTCLLLHFLCGRPSPLAYTGSHGAAFTVNVALIANQWQAAPRVNHFLETTL